VGQTVSRSSCAGDVDLRRTVLRQKNPPGQLWIVVCLPMKNCNHFVVEAVQSAAVVVAALGLRTELGK
jgi:hypothetical protein